jgi:hypothetical protein
MFQLNSLTHWKLFLSIFIKLYSFTNTFAINYFQWKLEKNFFSLIYTIVKCSRQTSETSFILNSKFRIKRTNATSTSISVFSYGQARVIFFQFLSLLFWDTNTLLLERNDKPFVVI